MARNTIYTSAIEDLTNIRQIIEADKTRDFYKGTSFHMSGPWLEDTHYFHDEFIVDFVAHDGAFLYCKEGHMSNIGNAPIIIKDINGNSVGIEESAYWGFVVGGSPGPDGKVWNPIIDANGVITWTLEDIPVQQGINIRGPQGLPGKDAYTFAEEQGYIGTKEQFAKDLAEVPNKVNRSGDTMTGPLILSGNPTSNNMAVNKAYVDGIISGIESGAFTFRGFISETQPTADIRVGNYWYQSADWNIAFPWTVSVWNGSMWIAGTSYTPIALDLWSRLSDSTGWYYFGEDWNRLDFSGSAFNPAHFTVIDGEVSLADGGITDTQIANNANIQISKINGLTSELTTIKEGVAGNTIRIEELEELIQENPQLHTFNPDQFTDINNMVSIKNGGITNTEIADNANIDASKINLSNYYTGTEVDSLLSTKANDSDVVHKSGDTVTGVINFNVLPTTSVPIEGITNDNQFVTKAYADRYGGIEEAPIDGELYGRMDAAWAPVVIPPAELREVNLSAQIDGTKTDFIIDDVTIDKEAISLYYNGQRQFQPVNFTYDPNTHIITTAFTPEVGDVLFAVVGNFDAAEPDLYTPVVDILVDEHTVVVNRVGRIYLQPIRDSIEREASQRDTEDQRIEAKIDAEITRSADVDWELLDRITTETAEREGNYDILTGAIATINENIIRIDGEIDVHDRLISEISANQFNRYTKTETDNLLALKADKTEVSTLSNTVANKADRAELSNYLPLSGGTMTGPIVMPSAPTASNHLANKAYVDQAVGSGGGGGGGHAFDSTYFSIEDNTVSLKPSVIGDNEVSSISTSKVNGLDTHLETIDTEISSITTDILNINTELASKASSTDLSAEVANRTSADTNLQNQITAIDDKVDAEITRSLSADSTLQTNITNVDNKLNKNVVTDISYAGSATGITRNRTFTNLQTGATSVTSEAMPIVSNTNAGIVLPDLFITVNTNTDRITNIEANTSVELTNQPTKADLDNYTIPSTAKAGDMAIVQADETQGGASTRYRLAGDPLAWAFDLKYGAPTPQATQSSLGTVKGNTSEGTVAVETDGSMSVNGWDALKNSVPTQVSQLTNDANYISSTQVDTKLANKVDKVIAASRVYGTDSVGNQSTLPWSESASVTQQTVAVRSNSGNLAVPTSVTGDNAIGATQVDNKISTALTGKVNTNSTPSVLYGTSNTGAQVTIPYSNVDGANTIVQRRSDANIAVPVNVTGNRAIGADQVDSKIASALTGKANDNAVVHLTGEETVNGIKTFGSIPVLPSTDPTTANQAVRKSYVDNSVAGKANASDVYTKTQVDSALSSKANQSDLATLQSTVTTQETVLNSKANTADVVNIVGAQNITGVKNFTVSPTGPTPTTGSQLANKSYVDNSVSSKANASDVVTLTGTQTITGTKTFNTLPLLPSTSPTADNQAVRKRYVDDAITTAVNNLPPPVVDKRLWVGTQTQYNNLISKSTDYLYFIIPE